MMRLSFAATAAGVSGAARVDGMEVGEAAGCGEAIEDATGIGVASAEMDGLGITAATCGGGLDGSAC